MIRHVFTRSLSEARRWNRDKFQLYFRRLKTCRPSVFLLYLFLVFLLFIYVSSSSSSSSSSSLKSSNNYKIKREEDKEELEVGGADKQLGRDEEKNSLPLVAINPHNFHLMISNTGRCTNLKKVNLLILVTSAAKHLDRREAIRKTWGEEGYLSSYGSRLLFLLANPNDSNIQRKIVEEYRTFGDTIQEDFVESYLNLTLKTVMGIKWASNYCRKASFVMKTDDDIFVNIPLLLECLIDFQGTRIFAGCIKQRKSFKPVNAEKPLPQAHPPFAAGAGYVFSGSMLKDLYEASLGKRIIPVEDVYVTAHLAKSVGAHPPVHDERYSCGELVMNDCDMAKMFTGHKVTPDQMHRIWKKLNKGTCET